MPFFGLNDYFWVLVWFNAEKVFILFSWIRVISFGQFGPISQGWNNFRIHPVGILLVEFDNLIKNLIKIFNFFICRFVTEDVIPIHEWNCTLYIYRKCIFVIPNFPLVRWRKRYVEIKWSIYNIIMAFIINSSLDSNIT